jgi:fructose-1,6-bisphosphatase/inositol monophosphatase family enzyme
VADGTIDGFVDIRGKLRSTDMAGACLIIKEAGAKITTPEGKPLSVKLDPKKTVSFIAAANPKIHRKILNITRIKKEAK